MITFPVFASITARTLLRGNMPAAETKEQSNESNTKVIMLIEAKIQPQRRTELIEAAQQYIPLVRAEPGVEAFLPEHATGRSQYIYFLRGVQVTSGAGLSFAAGLHQEIPGNFKERPGGRPCKDKAGRRGRANRGALQVARANHT